MANVLLVAPIPTHPPDGGNHARVLALADTLRQLGHTVTFVHSAWCPGSRRQMRRYWGDRYIRVRYFWPRSLWLPILLSRISQVLGLSVVHRWTRRWWLKNRPLDLWYDERLDAVLKRIQEREHFDAVLVVYTHWTRAFEQFGPKTLKLLDTQDILTDRYRLWLTSRSVPRFWPWGSVSITAEDEARGLARTDVILAIQSTEAEHYQRQSDRRVVTLGHLLAQIDSPAAAPESQDLLFVGSIWGPNVEGMLWFLEHVWPEVHRQVPAARLRLAGRVCRCLPNVEGCLKLGVVKDLNALYRQVAVAINPVPSGTGLAIKSIEALGLGRPLVASPCGARGLEEATRPALAVADTPEEWIETIVGLLQDRDAWLRASHAATAFATSWNQRQFGQFQSVLEQVQATPQEDARG